MTLSILVIKIPNDANKPSLADELFSTVRGSLAEALFGAPVAEFATLAV